MKLIQDLEKEWADNINADVKKMLRIWMRFISLRAVQL